MRTGRRQLLTPIQIVELRAWHKTRAALGTNRSKARELRISEHTLLNYIHGRHKFDESKQ